MERDAPPRELFESILIGVMAIHHHSMGYGGMWELPFLQVSAGFISMLPSFSIKLLGEQFSSYLTAVARNQTLRLSILKEPVTICRSF